MVRERTVTAELRHVDFTPLQQATEDSSLHLSAGSRAGPCDRELIDGEFKELMKNLFGADEVEKRKLSGDAEARAQKIVDGVADLVLNRLLLPF